MVRYKILMAVIDGAGDRPDPRVNNLTPLEAADTPNLDELAKRGDLGLLLPIDENIAPESDAAVFSLLGYNPLKHDLSRGVVEALGAGLEFRDGWLALRCNFATIEDRRVVDRRVGRSLASEEAKILAKTINREVKLEGADFVFRATVGHRAVLVIRDHAIGRLSADISNLDPAYRRLGKIAVAAAKESMVLEDVKPLSEAPEAARAAQLVNEFAWRTHEVLREHPVNRERELKGLLPANFILMRDAGDSLPKLVPFQEKYGLKGIMLADMPVELGIAKVLGLDVERYRPERTISSYMSRALGAAKNLELYDFVYVHLKGPDEPGHDGDFEGKVKEIENIDRWFFGRLLELIDLDRTAIVVTSDHATPWSVRRHTDDPVPLMIVAPPIKPRFLKGLSERHAKEGGLGLIRGYELMGMIIKLVEGGE